MRPHEGRQRSHPRPTVASRGWRSSAFSKRSIADFLAILGVAAVHRTGSLQVGETSVAVAVSTSHRVDAFPAGQFLIDELKKRAPIWKKEHWPGGAEWVREDHHHS